MKMFTKGRIIIIAALLFTMFALPAYSAMSDEEFLKLCRLGSSWKVAEAIKSGANVNAIDKDSKTALMLAVLASAPNTVSILLNAGADIHVKDKFGKTALDYARGSNKNGIITLITNNSQKRDNSKPETHKPERQSSLNTKHNSRTPKNNTRPALSNAQVKFSKFLNEIFKKAEKPWDELTDDEKWERLGE